MFLSTDIRGGGLPAKTLCLTYDDGPGEQTAELGEYLFQQGIQAAFFAIGRRAAAAPGTLAQLARWGHLMANHTSTHPDLRRLPPDGEALVREVLDAHAAIADAAIAGTAGGVRRLLRAPYGYWSSDVARLLNADARTRRYTGPVYWDMNGEDWRHWRDGVSAEVCADDYFEVIERKGSGIVLMHDSSAEEELAQVNDTCRMTRLLIPRLLDDGYRFVRLDAVPEVRSALGEDRHLFLSPHCDDAVLSCGGQIRQRVEQGQRVQVLTLFAGRPGAGLSPFARELHRLWGDPPDLVGLRRAEDEEALRLLGAEPLRLDEREALYRQGPDGAWLYPDRESLFGAVHPAERQRPAELAAAVARHLPETGGVTVHAPLGVGNHVDHQIAHAAARCLEERGIAVWFYEDYPYAGRPGRVEQARAARGAGQWEPLVIPLTEEQVSARVEAIHAYGSQLFSLFHDRGETPGEHVRRTAAAVGAGRPAERIWIP
jgi:peptidoglycan/xylan/chitin deacetylase (PgdA/CDA1 family)/LmbE family N-acetylglucosaminyl deacetylase